MTRRLLESLRRFPLGYYIKPRDIHVDRLIAIKVLLPGKVADPSRKTHFVQQTKAVQSAATR